MSEVRKLDRIETEIMEPLIDGTFREATVQKWGWQCLGCGLAWAIRWHAESCEERRHVPRWEQRYARGAVVNGRPEREFSYPRSALGRYPLPHEADTGYQKLPGPSANSEGTSTGRTFAFTAKVLNIDLVNVYSPRGGMITISHSQLPESLGNKIRLAAWDCQPLRLTLAEAKELKTFDLKLSQEAADAPST